MTNRTNGAPPFAGGECPTCHPDPIVPPVQDKPKGEGRKRSHGHRSRSLSRTAMKYSVSSTSHARSGETSHAEPIAPLPKLPHSGGKAKRKRCPSTSNCHTSCAQTQPSTACTSFVIGVPTRHTAHSVLLLSERRPLDLWACQAFAPNGTPKPAISTLSAALGTAAPICQIHCFSWYRDGCWQLLMNCPHGWLHRYRRSLQIWRTIWQRNCHSSSTSVSMCAPL